METRVDTRGTTQGTPVLVFQSPVSFCCICNAPYVEMDGCPFCVDCRAEQEAQMRDYHDWLIERRPL